MNNVVEDAKVLSQVWGLYKGASGGGNLSETVEDAKALSRVWELYGGWLKESFNPFYLLKFTFQFCLR